MAESRQIDLYEFLIESELQHYYNSIKSELKITNVVHLKYALDEDLKLIGLSRPEIRRLRKFYDKYYPHGYLSKFKRLLQNPRRDEGTVPNQMVSTTELVKPANSPSKVPSNKHIIPAESICINKQLGTGEFGIVQQGVWTNGTERIQVAIKCLSRERMQSNPMEFLKEAGIMHSIDHENIVRLYGVVLGTDSLMLVTELAHLRSLLECLKDSGLRVNFLTVPTLCEFAMQICNGMMYLENKRLIHRDLAARNILVFSKNKVKISDFGLSRALGVGKDYYKTNFNVNLKLPIAWCAPECINYLRFTNASDVWAYGVCLWEMFSYGFQPWAALTGIQILEAIDEPNYQRLEQPECCPREYYSLMLKCWAHDPAKRPKFSDIYGTLPDMKPEQLKTVVSNCEQPKKDNLLYRQGEIVTVLDKCTNSQYWKGILNSGKTGLFDPANTVAYVEGLPTSNNRDSFYRTSDRQSKRKLRSEMISMPQNDFKHTGHVGLDGAYFGDVSFIASSQNYNQLPRQIVTPYKPSEDIEQTPLLLPPTPTSPDSLQTASGYFPEATSSTNPSFVNSNENTPKHQSSAFGTSFDFSPQSLFSASNPFASSATTSATLALQNNNYGLEANAFSNANLEDDSALSAVPQSKSVKWMESDSDVQHEYHEISDDEITIGTGPSLMDELSSMFGAMVSAGGTSSITADTGHIDSGPKSPDFEHTNKKNEITELAAKLIRKNSVGDTNGNKSKKKTTGTVKSISLKDEKILNHAIEMANEINTRSANEMSSQESPTIQSPRRKFSFRFPNLTHHTLDKDGGGGLATSSQLNGNSGTLTHNKDRKNFTDELKNIPDLQNSLTDEHKEAYNSLIERKPTMTASLIGKFEAQQFHLTSAKTLPKMFSMGSGGKASRFMGGGDIVEIRDLNFSVPTQQAPRPTTLPHRLRSQRLDKTRDEQTSLRIVTQPSSMASRHRTTSTDDDMNANVTKSTFDGSDKESSCESPSYMTNTSYTFPEKRNSFSLKCKNGNMPTNPIPLPPRDRNKTMPANVKRHVRKHPLIIPGAGLQRTLNKVRDTTPVDDEPKVPFVTIQQIDRNLNQVGRSDFNAESNKMAGILDRASRVSLTNDDGDSFNGSSSNSYRNDDLMRTYQNIDRLALSRDNTDCASLHFESILEDNLFTTDNINSPDIVDGFCPFSIQKDVYSKSREIDFDNSNLSDSSEK